MRITDFGILRPSHMSIFIFQLNTNNRTAILEHQSLQLLPKLVEILFNCLKISFVICSWFIILCTLYPVREASIPHLSMNPGTNPKEHLQTHLPTELNKSSDIPSARKIPFIFFLFMMNPEKIGSHNIYSTGFHLSKLFFPGIVFPSGIMEFSHRRQDSFMIIQQASAVRRVFIPFFIFMLIIACKNVYFIFPISNFKRKHHRFPPECFRASSAKSSHLQPSGCYFRPFRCMLIIRCFPISAIK